MKMLNEIQAAPCAPAHCRDLRRAGIPQRLRRRKSDAPLVITSSTSTHAAGRTSSLARSGSTLKASLTLAGGFPARVSLGGGFSRSRPRRHRATVLDWSALALAYRPAEAARLQPLG
jgi:hypothetical protein